MQTYQLSQNWWQLVLAAVVCYVIGSFNFAVIIARFKKKDITRLGSGNPGTMNMTRELGWKVGVATFLCDALKGGVPVVIVHLLFKNYYFAGTSVCVSDLMRYFCGVFIVIGHIFPVFLRFKGGKGIASTLGIFWFGLACENAWWLFICFGLCLLLVLFIMWTEWGAMGSLLGTTGFSIIQMVIFLLEYPTPFHAYLVGAFMCIFVMNILTWTAHDKNLLRLFSGEERRTSLKKLIKKNK